MHDRQELLKVLEIEVNRINHLDTILFNIKVWTVTLVTFLVGFTFKLRSETQLFLERHELFYLAFASTLIFFVINVNFRNIQLKNVRNTREIRAYLKSEFESDQGSNIWQRLWDEELTTRGKFSQWFQDYWYSFLVYSLVFIIILILFLQK